ncbi:LppA family lipoprotein [Amycolatopsis sp. M39]|uniref:LppA family lipoprotein n=1 Tax=Amycolatopsis TaxID=1813 RepID=UPI0035106739
MTRDAVDRWAGRWLTDESLLWEALDWWALDLVHGIDLRHGPGGAAKRAPFFRRVHRFTCSRTSSDPVTTSGGFGPGPDARRPPHVHRPLIPGGRPTAPGTPAWRGTCGPAQHRRRCRHPLTAPSWNTSRPPRGTGPRARHGRRRAETPRHRSGSYLPRERLTAEFGRTWEQGGELSGETCGNDYPGLDADGRELRPAPHWDSPGNLPDSDWPRAQALAGQLAAGYGFNPTPKVLHQPTWQPRRGPHFGTGKYTTLRAETGPRRSQT